MDPGEPIPRQKMVLIVEDHRDTAEMLELILVSEGYRVRTAETADEALKTISNDAAAEIDLVLLDLTLPDMNGDDLILRLKQSCASVPPIFIMSAKAASSLSEAACMIGAAGVIRKPFDIQVLLENLQAELGKRPEK